MDNEIIAQCKKGDLSQFGKLYDKYAQQIYRFIVFKTCNRESAEDLTSITFMKALEGIKGFNPDKASFKTWLYQIARNTTIDHFRSNRETVDLEDAWGVQSVTDVAKETEQKLQLEHVEKYMAQLKPDQREIILLRVWGGHSFAEISEITGKTEAASKMMFKRSMDTLLDDLVPLIAILLLIR